MKKFPEIVKATVTGIRSFLEERGVGTVEGEASRAQRFAHFWLMVAKSFSRNRCPVRAAALAYTTLLALIPTLAIAISVSTSILKNQGEGQILHLVDKLVTSIVPPAEPDTNATSAMTVPNEDRQPVRHAGAEPTEATATNLVNTNAAAAGMESGSTNVPAGVSAGAGEPEEGGIAGGDLRKQLARNLHQFIKSTSSTAWGATGTILLVFVAISMLARVEDTFNDIWGVERGRNWFARIWHYSAVITVGPILLGLALGFAAGPRLDNARRLIEPVDHTGLTALALRCLPIAMLCLTFAVFYVLMPNTRVHWGAAVAGGVVAGVLWHLNNALSVHYVSRVITNSRIYGSLAIVPVFMIGLYIAWLILLFGAQVSYAYQNRASYVQAKQAENVNQRGREFIALRVMAAIGWRFQRGEPPATGTEIALQLAVPSRLVQQLLHTLASARLVVEVCGAETAYAPGRPLEQVTCHDVLQALRAGQGHELATSDEPARAEVYGEFQQIMEAEQRAASAVTLLMMVNRVQALPLAAAPQVHG